MNLCNINVIRSLMEDAGISFRKEFGQNFLINPMVPEDIADMCCDREDSLIVEIGPGVGCLTDALARRYERVVAIEIDKGLIPVLEKTMAEHENVTVINADVMEVDLAALVEKYSEGRPVSVAANLPYYITTPILMRLLESGVRFSSITVMVQNEVAARLCSKREARITARSPPSSATTERRAVSSVCRQDASFPHRRWIVPLFVLTFILLQNINRKMRNSSFL